MSKTVTSEQRKELGRMGGPMSAARSTPEEKREQGRRGMRVVLTRRIDPDGELERRDPAEFERRYAAALTQQMAAMNAARAANADARRAEKKSAKAAAAAPRAIPLPYLFTACPECNAAAGITLPDGAPTALCVKHYLCGRPWWPLGAHEWSIRKSWLVDGSVQVRTPRA